MLWNSYVRCLLLTALLASLVPTARGQQSGQISGKVSMKETGGPLHGASVLMSSWDEARSAMTMDLMHSIAFLQAVITWLPIWRVSSPKEPVS